MTLKQAMASFGTMALIFAFAFAAATADAQTTGTGATTTVDTTVTGTGADTGTTAATPGLPNTGAGGDAAGNLVSIALSSAAVALGAAYIARRLRSGANA